jgi:hypothetical protein
MISAKSEWHMGGRGSGNWSRNGKGTTEAAKRIDIRYLKKRGYLTPGTYGSLSWAYGGEPSGSIRFVTGIGWIQLIYRCREYDGDWEEVNYYVDFDETICHYGGTRKWFLCPGQWCGRRVGVLYGEGKYFLCRHCYDLAYSSQNEDKAQRASRKSRKIIERLGGDPYDEDYPDKPKGMRWKTYDRLIQEADYYEKLSWHYMGAWLSRFADCIEPLD